MRDWLAEVRARLAAEGHLAALPRDVIEEVAQHIADVHRAALNQGTSEAEAEARVALEFANIRDLVDACARRQRLAPAAMAPGASILGGVWHDVLQTWRLLRARPGYSSIVILTLAVGIGCCTAVFSLFNSLVLGPLP